MKVSAQATPSPETMPERRFFESVRWMHSTATGPTVIDAATPTQSPRKRTSMYSNPMVSSALCFECAKIRISRAQKQIYLLFCPDGSI